MRPWAGPPGRYGTTLALVVVLLVASAVVAGAAKASSSEPVFRVEPCPPDVFPAEVRVECGSVAVRESRARRHGRMIRVAAAVVRAPSPHPSRDPILFLNGGPSFGAISPFALGSYFAQAPYVQDRDLILVDTRGTGISRPRLGCPEFDHALESAFYSKPLVDSSWVADNSEAVEACRDRLSGRGIDLSAYNSAESAADLDDLRRALGYKHWNLLALSADGVLGLTYMRLFPSRIRSAILDSPASPQHLGELDYMRGLAENLERVFAGCAANAACNARYPNIRALFLDLVRKLQAHPRVIPIADFSPQPVKFRVDGVVFYRDALFGVFPGDRDFPDTIHTLLAEIWRSTHGELEAVIRERYGVGPFTSDSNAFVAEGKTMSYLCRDVHGFIGRQDIRRAARDLPALAPYFLDPHFGLPTGPAGCRIWGVGVADAAQHQPVTSRIPTLVLAGEYDTSVPAFIVRQIPPTLPNSFSYEFPAAPHGQLADYNPVSPCARSIADQFLRAPARRPDSRCVKTLPPFDFTPPSGITPQQRRPAPGRNDTAAVAFRPQR